MNRKISLILTLLLAASIGWAQDDEEEEEDEVAAPAAPAPVKKKMRTASSASTNKISVSMNLLGFDEIAIGFEPTDGFRAVGIVGYHSVKSEAEYLAGVNLYKVMPGPGVSILPGVTVSYASQQKGDVTDLTAGVLLGSEYKFSPAFGIQGDLGVVYYSNKTKSTTQVNTVDPLTSIPTTSDVTTTTTITGINTQSAIWVNWYFH